MTLLRTRYLQGLFRWQPALELIEPPGEADAWEFCVSEHRAAAWAAARCVDMAWSDDAREWAAEVDEAGLAVAVEQCCHDGRLLPCELRALRLQRFEASTAYHTEQALARLPIDCGTTALGFLWWYVRIERARRTGFADLDPLRGPAVVDS